MRRIGILGAAGIAPQAAIEPARRRNDVIVEAVASRRPGVAAEFAKKHKIAQSFESYEALLAAPNVDIVYVALPPGHHAEWSIAALEAGKDVLCEKPFAVSAAEATQMVAAAQRSGKHLIEAFHYRFHPVFQHMQTRLAANAVGTIRSIRAELAIEHPAEQKSFHHDKALGGGALMDLGCYTVHMVRALLGQEPEVVAATAKENAQGVDESFTATLQFPPNVFVDLSCSMARGVRAAGLLRIEGDKGNIEVRNPVLPHDGHAIRERLNGGTLQHTVAGNTTYDYQLQHILDVLDGRAEPLTGGNDAIANMRVIDAIFARAGLR
jgi:predicted dehydrogenase